MSSFAYDMEAYKNISPFRGKMKKIGGTVHVFNEHWFNSVKIKEHYNDL